MKVIVMMQDAKTRGRALTRLSGCLLVALGLPLTWACGDTDADPIVGSMQVDEQATDVMFVETVRISMPFKAVVYNGEARKVVIRGEDNLIAHIDVVETAMSDWEIVAPKNLEFEQHDDIEIEIPFIDMVEISIDGDIEFADDPIKVWNEQEGESRPTD